MGRTRNQSILSDLFDFLAAAPVWMGPLVAATAYCGLYWGIPAILSVQGDNGEGVIFAKVIGPITTKLAPWAAVVEAVLWIAAEVKKRSQRHQPGHMSETGSMPTCGSCGAAMVLRTAKQGPTVGSRFWGCSRYPACRGTEPCEKAC